MAAPLGFQHQREGGVAGDVDAGDVVHLDRDFEGHLALTGGGQRYAAARRAEWQAGPSEWPRPHRKRSLIVERKREAGRDDDDVEADAGGRRRPDSA